MERVDCVVIGAGWYGLAAAKQYRCTRPDDSLAVFESQASIGGTWADERLYPDLKSNNLFGTYEYPDFPMDSERFGIKPGQYIPGHILNTYLKAYAVNFGIDRLIRLSTKVLAAEHHDDANGGWTLTVIDDQRGQSQLFTRRLVIATGMTSEAFLPRFEGQDHFGGPVFHGKYFLQNKDTLQTAKTVTVFGATKFSWDAVYSYVRAGVKVNWVIRASGHGPCWMSPSYVTPFKRWIEKLANTRFLTWFSPCVWGDADGYAGVRRLLHETTIGRFIVDCFWKILGNDVIQRNDYDSHPKTAKLKPWTSAMFTGPSFSILNYETDFFDLVKDDNVDIHIGEIDHLSPGTVHLSDGTSFKSDAILAHTGWKQVPPLKFLPEGIAAELGVPHLQQESFTAATDDLANQHDVQAQVDTEILTRFPRLRKQEVWNKDYVPLAEQKGLVVNPEDATTPYNGLTPFMLYHFIVPPSPRFLRPRDIAFVGIVGNFSNTLTAHIQGLWVSAYFSGLLKNDPGAAASDEAALGRVRYETALHNRFGKWRYPVDWGNKAPCFIFDAVPYLDLLQRDLGLDPHRKAGFLSEMLSPYGADDYRNINDEWRQKVLGDS
ncbi:flavin-binding monooxygenase-like family protein [Purpureocillium lavendulum]|uniref:Flavin-binding monooxygenase-like family protein n=1 Tax=Purpureocillium lavendulum TaxID=1247861 RepID=A0AB34FSJ3_9HYPO|nr:flavin-binding monooxygenase-like family protein [Purpureocillium lavendulum]